MFLGILDTMFQMKRTAQIAVLLLGALWQLLSGDKEGCHSAGFNTVTNHGQHLLLGGMALIFRYILIFIFPQEFDCVNLFVLFSCTQL